MDVPAAGASPASRESPAALTAALKVLAASSESRIANAAGVSTSNDTIADTLSLLSEIDVPKLLEILAHTPSPQDAAKADGLLHASIAAASQGKVEEALGTLAELAKLDPQRAESLAQEPGLDVIRPAVTQLLTRMAAAAGSDAQLRLKQATDLLAGADLSKFSQAAVPPQTAVVIAGRLIEAGGYANYIGALSLSEMVIDYYGRPSGTSMSRSRPKSAADLSERGWGRWAQAIGRLWQRAPLLVLLLGWFAAGLLGGSAYAILQMSGPQTWVQPLVTPAFEVWGIGFLSLVGFGFYSTVRHWRR